MSAARSEQLVHRRTYVAAATLLALAAPASARAAAACDGAALGALGVPGVTVLQAVPVPAGGGNPAFCSVVAAVATSGFGAPDGSATVLLDLPATWNGKFLFFGTGGLAGVLSPSANAPDVVTALARGYATANTDTGHQGNGLTPADGLGKGVEQGRAPDAIVAAHFAGNDPTKPIDRSMPLCPFPTQATYDGKGDPMAAASWSCQPNAKLRRVGSNGVQAGLVGPLARD